MRSNVGVMRGSRKLKNPKDKEVKPLYEQTYSDGTKAIVSYKSKVGKAKGEAGEMGLRITKVRRIKKPTFMQRFERW